jgi:hypothetical protein
VAKASPPEPRARDYDDAIERGVIRMRIADAQVGSRGGTTTRLARLLANAKPENVAPSQAHDAKDDWPNTAHQRRRDTTYQDEARTPGRSNR